MQRQFAGVDGPRYLGLGGALLRANWEPDAAEFGTDARSCPPNACASPMLPCS